MSRMSRIFVALAAAALATGGVAWAADPESGSVSFSAPKVEWSGSLTAPYASYGPMFAQNGDASVPCQAPSCDRFTLEVKDTATLLVQAEWTADPSGSIALMRIVKPDGSVQFGTDDTAGPHKMKIKAAPKGTYLIDLTHGAKAQASYKAFAQLETPPAVVAPAPPAAAPAPPAAPAPAPAKPAAKKKPSCAAKAKKIKNAKKRKAALKRCRAKKR